MATQTIAHGQSSNGEATRGTSNISHRGFRCPSGCGQNYATTAGYTM
jgi:hypothetical protein